MKQYHIGVDSGDIGRYVLLPGDPGRCKMIASYFDNPCFVASNREFTTYTGKLLGERVSVTSTGIGGPSCAIAIEELAKCGADTFIRVGTCGGIDTGVLPGDIIIATGAVRQDGTSYEYVPPGYPAVADFFITSALVQASKNLKYRYHTGVVQSKDSFYGQHNPESMPVADELLSKWDAYKKLGVLGSEMETSTVFTVSNTLHARAGAVLFAVWNQELRNEKKFDNSCFNTENAVITAIEALKLIISGDIN